MLSPPSANGRHTELQATRALPRRGLPHARKKLCMALSRHRRTSPGIPKADMKYVGMAERIAFTSTTRPPRDSNRPHQPPRRVSTFSIIGYQSWILRQRSINGRPMYQIGSVLIGVARLLTQRNISSVASPNPTNKDLARFSWRLEKLANISIIWERVRATISEP